VDYQLLTEEWVVQPMKYQLAFFIKTQGCHGQEKLNFNRGQGKAREFCIRSGNSKFLFKVSEKSWKISHGFFFLFQWVSTLKISFQSYSLGVELETCSHCPLDVIKGFRRSDDLRNKSDVGFCIMLFTVPEDLILCSTLLDYTVLSVGSL